MHTRGKADQDVSFCPDDVDAITLIEIRGFRRDESGEQKERWESFGLRSVVIANLVVAHKDRLFREGFEYFEHFVSSHGGNLITANQQSLSPQQELTEDLMSVIHCFSCRLYGVRKYKKEIEEKVLELPLDKTCQNL